MSGMCQKFYFPQRSMRNHIPAIEFDVYKFNRFSRSKYARKIFHRLQIQIKQEQWIYWFSEAAVFHNDTKLISIYFTTRMNNFVAVPEWCVTHADCRLADLQTNRLGDLQTCRPADSTYPPFLFHF